MNLQHAIFTLIIVILLLVLINSSVLIFLLKRDYVLSRSSENKKTDIAVIKVEMESIKKDIKEIDFEVKNIKGWCDLHRMK
jgi:hypothetical protein